MQGIDPNGQLRTLQVTEFGELKVVGGTGGGGGGGGDASAANQLTQIARLDTLVEQSDTVESTLAQIRDRLPVTAHSQPLTDAQMRAAPIAVAVPGDVCVAEVLSPADHSASAEWDLSAVSASDVVTVETERNQRTIALTLDPASSPSYSEIRSAKVIDSPGEVSAHVSMSQRVRLDVGTMALVDRSATLPAPEGIGIASITQATTTCTVVLTSPFQGRIGDLVDIVGSPDNRLWYQFAPVATISEDGLTLTIQFTDSGAIPPLTVGPIAGGTLKYSPDAIGRAVSGGAIAFSSNTATSADLFARSGGVTRLSSAVTSIAGDRRTGTASTSRQIMSGGKGHATGATAEFCIEAYPGEIHFRDRTADSTGVWTARALIESSAMSVSRALTPIFSAFEPAGMPRPLARIVSVVRATNVVTVTLDRGAASAGFAVGQYPHIYGVRDTTNFANTVFSSAITAVSGSTFTVAWAGTNATSYGGAVSLPAGGISQQGLSGVAVQSVTRNADDSLTLVGSTTWSGFSVDDIVAAVGVRDAPTGADLGVDGLWRVSSISTSAATFRPVTDALGVRRSPAVTTTPQTNCGGAVILATTIRVHSFRAVERRINEVRIWGQGTNSPGHALPVAISNSFTLPVNANEAATLSPSTYSAVTAATTNGAAVRTSAGTLWSVSVANTTAATAFIKLYNKASAPTVGTDVPVITIPVAAGEYKTVDYGRLGMRFGTGIAVAVTGAMGATDTTAVAAGAQVMLSYT